MKRTSVMVLLGLGLGVWASVPEDVAAHFILEEPESWREQSFLGDPQKMGPCGNEGTADFTGAITTYAPGDTVTIRIDEVIFHPGHYRVALAVNDPSELPPPPPVTPGATDCGSVPIMSPAVFPVLADGLLQHDTRLVGPQTIEVTLPTDVECERCTLQVMEWMSYHATPCFYYHCADIAIRNPARDAGTASGTDGGAVPSSSGASCGCSIPGRASHRPAALAFGALIALAALRRRRS